MSKDRDRLLEVLRGAHTHGSEVQRQIEEVPAGMQQMRPPGVEPGSQAWEACMMPLHQERLDVEVFLKVMLLFHTLAREALHHLLRSRCLAAVNNVTPGRNHGARGVVVSHPLSMREALGSIPSVSSLILSGSTPWAKRHI